MRSDDVLILRAVLKFFRVSPICMQKYFEISEKKCSIEDIDQTSAATYKERGRKDYGRQTGYCGPYG